MPANIWLPSTAMGTPVATYNVDTERLDIDVSKEIYELEPDATPFLVIANEVAYENATSLEYTWYQDAPDSCWGLVLADYDGVTDVIRIDGLKAGKDAILKNTTTGEVFNVRERINETDYRVDRQYGYETRNNVFVGGTPATPGTAGQNILLLSRAMAEGWDAPEPTGTQPTKEYNYIQTISNTIAVTEDNEVARKKAGQSERTRLNKKEGVNHLKEIERTVILGERMEHVDQMKRLTGGIMQFIRSNVYDVGALNGGILTEKGLERFCEMAFRYGSKSKLLKCSPRVGSIINELAKKYIQISDAKDTYGLRLSYYRSFHGTLYIATSEFFEKDYQGTGLVIDLDNIKLRYFDGHKSTLRKDVQARSSHTHKDEVYTQVGTKVMLEKTHAIITGVVDSDAA